MFVVVKYNKTIEMINLDNITEIKCDYISTKQVC